MLQYASLKAVLQYLDPNIRFEIHRLCPSIQKTEKAVPLYINSLEFMPGVSSPNRVDVNSTSYAVGTIRVYSTGSKMPHAHEAENMKGGVGSDLDRFGFEDYTSDTHLTPGDVSVGELRRELRLDENQIDAHIEELEALDMLLALKRGGRSFSLDRQHPQFQIMQEFKNRSVKDIRKYVRRRRHYYEPYLNERNNTAVPYTTEVQITVTSESEVEKVYRYPGRKLYQVEKKLLTLLFSGRKHIHVKSLEIYGEKILRFPVDMFFKIQQLFMIDNTFQMLDEISEFVNPASFPLKTITFFELKENEVQHVMVKSAKKLIILGLCGHMQTILEVVTQKVEIKRPDFDPEDYLVLARNWLETDRTVGTCYVFKFEEVSVVDEVMRLLKTELDAEAVGAECLKVRINETSKLKIAYQKVQEKWRMQFKVISE